MFTIEIEDGREAPSFFIASVSSSFIKGQHLFNCFGLLAVSDNVKYIRTYFK